MKEQAIEKVSQEVLGANNAPYISIIGDYLKQVVEVDPSAAKKILADGKTIAGSVSAMATEAKKRAVNGMAVLTDVEGFAIVLKYFGIDSTAVPETTLPVKAAKNNKNPKKAQKKKPSERVVQFPGQGYVQTTIDDFFGEEDF